MSWSMGETRALAQKATRGAGFPWGMAEEAGFAVIWLQAYGAPGVQALSQYLSWRETNRDTLTPLIEGSTLQQHDALYCPLALGTALSDSGKLPVGKLGVVQQPLLLAPFLATCSDATLYRLSFAEVRLCLNRHALHITGPRNGLLIEQALCQVQRQSGAQSIPASGTVHSRVPATEEQAIKVLHEFAARTYAPATEQSRLSGAGAGLGDND